jgi:hypothetical protein
MRSSHGHGLTLHPNASPPTTHRRTIVKKATEFGEAEVWMNERMMRSAPSVIAPFLTGFSEGEGRLGDPLWLVWRYEGASTLADCMARREFPYNLEGLLFERPLNIPEGPDRKAAIIRVGMQQLLQGLEACHYSGALLCSMMYVLHSKKHVCHACCSIPMTCRHCAPRHKAPELYRRGSRPSH